MRDDFNTESDREDCVEETVPVVPSNSVGEKVFVGQDHLK